MFQGEIEIINGLITNLHQREGYLRLNIDGKKFDFGNSFASVGFIDSHLHLLHGGEFLSMPDLTNAKSEEQCIDIIKQNPFYRGNWLFGRGWNQENWINKKFPTRESLDRAFPNQPVCLIRQDGHCLWLNSKALQICNISKNTPEPKGGKILKDETGEPNGILIDDALELVRPYLPRYSNEQYLMFLEQSIEYLSKFGITTVHDMDVDPDLIDVYQHYFASNRPKINVRLFLSGLKYELEPSKSKIHPNKYLQFVGLKYYMDGALGSYGALLFEPYSDKPDTQGLQLIEISKLKESFEFTARNQLGIVIHSIGDKATNLILLAYKEYSQTSQLKPKFFRIEHCQIVQKEDIPLFKSLDISASVQPIHFISDYQMAEKRLGKRTHFAYPWMSFIKNDVNLCSGSDFPIENPNPILGIYSLVNRENNDPKKIFGNETVGIEDAIRSYTINPSISIKEKPDGIKVGNSANLVILDKNPFQIEKVQIKEVKVLSTICQGKFIFQQ